jgi:uncharacterized membrane protein YfhO
VSGGTIANQDGLLAARVPQGQHHLTFRYLPRSVLIGGTISLLAALGAATFVVATRRRRFTAGS